MAKKFGKFLLFTAAVGSAAAAVYYYMRKKGSDDMMVDDDDYDDFSEDPDEDAELSRNYVPLTPDADTAGKEEGKDTFVPLDQVAPSAEKPEGTADESEKSDANIEEFFDEEDATEEEPPINDN